MKQIDRWFDRASARQQRAVFLEDALLTNNFSSYAIYRLRFFLGTSLIETGLHIVEFTILSFIFSQHLLIAALLLRTVGGLIVASWWGALEPMRSQLRQLKREGRMHQVDSIIARWYILATLVSGGILSLAIAWLVFDVLRPAHTFDVFHLFLLGVCLQVSLSILARTYHSVVYSFRRVYRPFLTIVGIQIFAFTGTLLLWPWAGIWSFPIMLFPTAIFGVFLTYVYVGRAYRFIGLKDVSLDFSISNIRSSLVLVVRSKFVMAGLSYASLRIDSLLVLALFGSSYNSSENFNLFLFFYIASPVIHAAYGWAQLFYFDLKRLELDLFYKIKERFTRFIRQTAWIMAIIFFSIASLIGTLFLSKNLGILYLLLALFFIVRSQLAFFQIRAFAEERYGLLILLGLFVVFVVFIIGGSVPGATAKFTFYVLALTPALLFLSPVFMNRYQPASQSRKTSLIDWISYLVKTKKVVRVRSICINKETDTWLVERMAQKIMRGLYPYGRLTLVSSKRITWFERSGLDHQLSDAQILATGLGFVTNISSTEYYNNGLLALEDAQKNGLLGKFKEKLLSSPVPVSLNDIRGSFKKLFADGILFDTDKDKQDNIYQLTSQQRREIMFGASEYSKYAFRPGKNHSFDVSSLLINGQIRFIFGIPKHSYEKQNKSWRTFIDQINFKCAAGTPIMEHSESYMSPFMIKRVVLWSLLILVAGLVWNIPMKDQTTGIFQLHSADRIELHAPIASFLKSTYFDEGSHVKANALIGNLDVPDLDSRIVRMKAETREAKANLSVYKSKNKKGAIAGKINEYKVQLSYARDNYEQAQTLLEKTVINDNEFRRIEKEYQVWQSQYQQLLSSLEAEQASLMGAEEELKYLESMKLLLKLISPIDGVITTQAFQRNVGSYYEEGDVIVEIENPGALEAEITIPERDIVSIEIGQVITLKVLGLPRETYEAKVERIAPVLTLDSQSNGLQARPDIMAKIYCRVDGVNTPLKIGMSGYARIHMGDMSAGQVLVKHLTNFIRTEFWW